MNGLMLLRRNLMDEFIKSSLITPPTCDLDSDQTITSVKTIIPKAYGESTSSRYARLLQCVSDTKDTEYPEKDTACEIAFLANYAETNNYQGSIGNRKLPDGSVHTYLRAGTVNKDTKKFSEARLSLVQTVDSTPSLFASFNTSEDASATQHNC